MGTRVAGTCGGFSCDDVRWACGVGSCSVGTVATWKTPSSACQKAQFCRPLPLPCRERAPLHRSVSVHSRRLSAQSDRSVIGPLTSRAWVVRLCTPRLSSCLRLGRAFARCTPEASRARCAVCTPWAKPARPRAPGSGPQRPAPRTPLRAHRSACYARARLTPLLFAAEESKRGRSAIASGHPHFGGQF